MYLGREVNQHHCQAITDSLDNRKARVNLELAEAPHHVHELDAIKVINLSFYSLDYFAHNTANLKLGTSFVG